MPDKGVAGPHQGQRTHAVGQPLATAQGALILVHGRGATAASILELGRLLHRPDFAYLAPQAAGNTWYPFTFLAPLPRNEPGLSSGLQVLADLVAQAQAAGVPAASVVLGGFSQGACLASEFVARNAQRYGGLLVFSGGVIGPAGAPRRYAGSLAGTPVFVGCSDSDPHIPLARVHETTEVFTRLGGQVVERIYPNIGHAIVQDEIDHARRIVEGVAAG